MARRARRAALDACSGRHPAGKDEAQTVMARLERRGVRVRACACDVTDCAALAALLGELHAKVPPLRGIVHAAAVIDDALIRDMSAAQIRRVLAPKVLERCICTS